MSALFKWLCLWLMVLGVVPSWAGTTSMGFGKPPVVTQQMLAGVASKSTVGSDQRCAQRLAEAQKVSALRAALAMWSACSGQKMALQNLDQLQTSDIAVIQSNIGSPQALQTQLCSLSRPLVGCTPTVVKASAEPAANLQANPTVVDAGLAPSKEESVPSPDVAMGPNVCEIDTSYSPSQSQVGVQSLIFKAKEGGAVDCVTPPGALIFMETKFGPAACSVLSGPVKTEGGIAFTIRFDLPANPELAFCNYIVFSGTNQVVGQLTVSAPSVK